MKDDIQMSHIPAEWGGPFVWHRNERCNLELISVASVAEAVSEINEVIRSHVAEVIR